MMMKAETSYLKYDGQIALCAPYIGSLSSKYLSYYFDKFASRFNRKLSTYRGKLFYRLMQQAVDKPLKPFEGIIK
jgi:hypothetical protein